MLHSFLKRELKISVIETSRWFFLLHKISRNSVLKLLSDILVIRLVLLNFTRINAYYFFQNLPFYLFHISYIFTVETLQISTECFLIDRFWWDCNLYLLITSLKQNDKDFGCEILEKKIILSDENKSVFFPW